MQAGHDKTLSKALTWLLRHGAEREGLQLLPGGFLPVERVLATRTLRRYSVQDVRRVVEQNDKQRFCLREDANNGLLIRANQGHSLQVNELELERIVSAEEFQTVIHGTYFKCLESIKQQGLSRMSRQHIHLAQGVQGQAGVISGMRASCQVHVHVNVDKAIADGIQFFKSANGVILTPGNDEGFLRPKYFTKIVDARTGCSYGIQLPSPVMVLR